jgi:hypothetical protein
VMATIGLVLGAGGLVGQAFHSGVLAALETDRRDFWIGSAVPDGRPVCPDGGGCRREEPACSTDSILPFGTFIGLSTSATWWVPVGPSSLDYVICVRGVLL